MYVEHSAPAEPGSSERQGPSKTLQTPCFQTDAGFVLKSTKGYTENAEVKLGRILCEISTAVSS